MNEQGWREKAACRGENPNFFFDSRNLRAIRKKCIGCPVYEECKAWATDPVTVEQAPHGIIAGYTGPQRLAIAGGIHIADWRAATGRNRTTPLKKVKASEASKKSGYDNLLKRAAERPQCPRCETGINVTKQRKNSSGEQVWRHLPCGMNFTAQDEAEWEATG